MTLLFTLMQEGGKTIPQYNQKEMKRQQVEGKKTSERLTERVDKDESFQSGCFEVEKRELTARSA